MSKIPEQLNGTVRYAIIAVIAVIIGWAGNSILSSPSELRAHAQTLTAHKERITANERAIRKLTESLSELQGDVKVIRTILEKEK